MKKQTNQPLVIYGRHTSYNVQKILWFLDEIKIQYKHIEFGGNPDDTETEVFGKLNPMRKVPVLVEGERVIWESNSILRYLLSEYGRGDWVVKDAYQRSLYERWMDWSQTAFEPAFIGVFWGYYRTPPSLHDQEYIDESLFNCQQCLEKLESQLAQQPFLAGQHLSLADVCAAVFIFRLVEIDLDVQLPQHVQSWYEILQHSEGYKHWVMSDFSSLKGRLQY